MSAALFNGGWSAGDAAGIEVARELLDAIDTKLSTAPGLVA